MILPDLNLLIYAHNPHSPDHRMAMDWWNRCLEGPRPIGLPLVVVLGFLRLATKRNFFPIPMTMLDALARIESWLARPHIHLIEAPPDHMATLGELLLKSGTIGDVVTDAHLAAIAIGKGFTIHSNDSDFDRFPGLSWTNPLAP